MGLTIADRARLRSLTHHTRHHAEQLLSEVDAPMHVSSTRRTPLRNRQVGGVPNSFHLRGRAVDFTGDVTTLERAARLAWHLRLGAGCTGPEEVLLEKLGRPGQHLHVAW
jgi:uncharacterized protein YcbK (DUF882 family)